MTQQLPQGLTLKPQAPAGLTLKPNVPETPPAVVDDRGWRIMEGKGMPPMGTMRTPEQQRMDQMYTGGTLGGAPPVQSEPSFNEVSDYYNISREGAPEDVLNLGDYTMEKEADYARLLSKHHDGKPVSVYRHPELDELVYKNPDTGQETLVQDPNSISQAMSANPAAITSLVGEIGAGIGGFTVGGPAGAIAAEMSMAFLTREARLNYGKAQGINNYSQGEIFINSLEDAAFTGLGGMFGEAGAALFRGLSGSGKVKTLLRGMTDDELDAVEVALKGMENKYDVDLSVGQVMQEARSPQAREFRTMEDRLKTESPDLREQAARQKVREEELIEPIDQQALPDEVASDLAPTITKEIEDVATKEVDDRIAAIERGRDDSLALYESELTNIVDSPDLIGTADNPGSYEQVVSALGEARSKIFGKDGTIGKQYDEFWGRVGEPDVSLTEVKSVASRHRDKLDSDIFPALAAEDADIVRNVIDSVDTVPMASVNRALSVIKSELRKTPDVRRGEKSFLIDMKDALSNVRNEALTTVDKNAARELKAIDTNYAKTSTDMDTAQINRILKTNEQGSFITPPITAIKALVGDSGRSAEAFMRMAKDSTSPVYGSLGTVRAGIRSLYRKTLEDKTGASRMAAHKAFMKANKDGMKRILTPNEFKGFNKGASSAMDAMKVAENKAKRDIRKIEQSFEGRLTNASNFDNLVDMVSKSNSPVRDTKKIKDLLKDSPELLDQYKGLRGRKVMNEVFKRDDMGNRTFDPSTIDNMLKSTDQLGELKALFGDQYVADLRLLRDFGDVTKPIKGESSEALSMLMAENPKMTPAAAIWRIYARPLSRMGLATTAVRKLGSSDSRAAVGKILANPKEFQKLMRMYRRGASLEKWRTVLTNTGLASWLEEE